MTLAMTFIPVSKSRGTTSNSRRQLPHDSVPACGIANPILCDSAHHSYVSELIPVRNSLSSGEQ